MTALGLLAGLLMTPSAPAALVVDIVSVQNVANSTLDADLTTLGTTDWVIWDAWSGSTGVAYDRKSGGSGIGDMTYSGGFGTVTEIGSATQGMRFDYSDGVNHGGTQTDINEGIGRTVRNYNTHSFSLTVDLAGPEGYLDLLISGDGRVKSDSQTLTATIGTDSASVSPDWDYANRFFQYRVNFSGATAGDTLDIDWVIDGSNIEYNSKVIMNAAALNVIPEPGTLALVGIAIAAVFLGARRKRG